MELGKKPCCNLKTLKKNGEKIYKISISSKKIEKKIN